MPPFQGQVSEEQIMQLIAYIRIAARPRRARGRRQDEVVLVAMSNVRADTTTATSTRRTASASWLLTKDHKRIAMLYLISITVFFAVGGMFAAGDPARAADAEGRPAVAGRPTTSCSRMHGVMMIFFFLIPSIPATLGNFLMPIMIGAKDLAFPRINLLSWYIYVVGADHRRWRAVVSGGIDTGWTFYTPYSTSRRTRTSMLDGASACSSPASRRSSPASTSSSRSTACGRRA